MAKNKAERKLARKEFFRKALVSLKRNPQYIPLGALMVSFLVFSLNLTSISNTTAKIMLPNMGLCAFISMLFSLLSFVCMLSAFPKRQKPNLLLMILMIVMYGGVIFADYTYYTRIVEALTREENRLTITKSTIYIQEAQTVMIVHIVLVAITILTVVLEPLFAKLLKKINTSIEVEDNGEIGQIDLTED